jgi:hypothetical protein
VAQVLSVESSPEAEAEVLASSDLTHLAILPQPPEASMIMGMKVMPRAAHSVRMSLCLQTRPANYKGFRPSNFLLNIDNTETPNPFWNRAHRPRAILVMYRQVFNLRILI